MKRKARPTEAQTRTLRMLQQNGGSMMYSMTPEPHYQDLRGNLIPEPVAKALIRNAWVSPQRDSLFDLSPQTWKVKAL